MKILKGFVATLFAVLTVILIIAVFVAVYFGINCLWDYAINTYGDLGAGFMFCLSVIIVIFGIFLLAKSFYEDLTKTKEEE